MLGAVTVLAVICCIAFIVWFVKNHDRTAGRKVTEVATKVADTAETLARKAGL